MESDDPSMQHSSNNSAQSVADVDELADCPIVQLSLSSSGKLRYDEVRNVNQKNMDEIPPLVDINDRNYEREHKRVMNEQRRRDYVVPQPIATTVRNGPYVQMHQNGTCFIKCTYVNGVRDGPYEENWPNGNPSIRSNYRNGKFNGPYEQWHNNGKPYIKCIYANKLRNGLYEQWHVNGNRFIKCSYINGQMDGSYEQWHDNGGLHIMCIYKIGVFHEGIFDDTPKPISDEMSP